MPLDWVVRMLLDRNSGLDTNTEPDLRDCVPISQDVALVLESLKDDSIRIQHPYKEWNQRNQYLLWHKRAYIQSYGRWLDNKKKQGERAAAAYQRDEALAQIAKAMEKEYDGMTPDQCHELAKTCVMQKNQILVDALGLQVDVSKLSDDATLKTEIVDKHWYQEEAKRKAARDEYTEF
jgi:hypothetical protein